MLSSAALRRVWMAILTRVLVFMYSSSFITLRKQSKPNGSFITESEKLVGTVRDTLSQAVGKLLLTSTSNTDGSTSEFYKVSSTKVIYINAASGGVGCI